MSDDPVLSHELKEVTTHSLPTTVHDVALSQGGEFLYAACLDGGIHRLDLASGETTLLSQHERYASGVHLLPDGNTLISAGYEGQLHWHDLREVKCFRQIQAHQFWSWQSALSPDGILIASATGQYLCGGYDYEPAPEREPSVRVFNTKTGQNVRDFPHVPPVESIAFSRNGRYLAAGNLMGEVRIWEIETGKQITTIRTPDFTGWGIIKGHYYTGGIFSLAFPAGDEELYLAGMGTTRDPAAGNGKQLWQRYAWKGEVPERTAETNSSENGAGLMETLTFHPSDSFFVMAGRLESGNWNAALFAHPTGELLHSISTESRVTRAVFNADGTKLYLAGGVNQGDKMEQSYGRVHVFEMVMS